MRLIDLFLSFLRIGLFSVGGGYAAMPLIQDQVVISHPWLTMSEFTDLITIAEMTPGPIAVNSATFVGMRIAGIPGALIATLGVIIPSLIIVSLLYFVYRKYREIPMLKSVLTCLRPTVVALIASAGLSILLMVIGVGEAVNYIGIALFAVAFFALRKFKFNPILTMLACGIINLVIHLHLQNLIFRRRSGNNNRSGARFVFKSKQNLDKNRRFPACRNCEVMLK